MMRDRVKWWLKRGRNDREVAQLLEDVVGLGAIVFVLVMLILASGLDH